MTRMISRLCIRACVADLLMLCPAVTPTETRLFWNRHALLFPEAATASTDHMFSHAVFTMQLLLLFVLLLLFTIIIRIFSIIVIRLLLI
jgi:hypothetical protein